MNKEVITGNRGQRIKVRMAVLYTKREELKNKPNNNRKEGKRQCRDYL